MSTQLQYHSGALAQQFAYALRQADELFGMLCEDAWTMRPISLRHPCVFYYGHFPAFAWNQVFRYTLGRRSFNAEFDALFERGIDPLDTDGFGVLGVETEWPALIEIAEYKAQVEASLFELLETPAAVDRKVLLALHMVLEHYLMHVETFAYMLHQLPWEFKRDGEGVSALPLSRIERVVKPDVVGIPGGMVTLGAERGAIDFGWCNEFGELKVVAPPFGVDRFPVTNAEYMEFVDAGGYSRPQLWSDDGWLWIRETKRAHPQFWLRSDDGWKFRGMHGSEPLLRSAPVWVSFVEAEAFAKWKGGRLPTEAEYHRVAFGTASGVERAYPWGYAVPRRRYGDFSELRFSPEPVGSHPEGVSAFGVQDLVGGGWEWTSSLFRPLPGFEPIETYPGYSADFFDDHHYVLKGASPVTPVRLIRRSFRNWFQPHYPYVYAKFRCVYPEGQFA